MKDHTQGLEALARFAVMFKDLADLGEDLKGVQSLISMESTAKSQADQARADRDAALLELAAAQDATEAAKKDADAIRAQAKEEAAAIVAKAKQDAAAAAAKVTEKASKDGLEIVAKARKEAEALTASQSKLAGEVAALKNECATLAEKRDGLAVEAAEKQSELNAVNAAIAKLRGAV